jgi:N-acetyltransferase
MRAEGPVLDGQTIRLEPLGRSHLDALVKAAAADPSLYRWSLVPQGRADMARYIDTALSWQEAGTAVPYAIVRAADGVVIGSTRFWNLEQWPWPPGHPSHGRSDPDVCEIGYTWLGSSGTRTAANTQAKLLMLTHAFEQWRVLGVCFYTDARNERSRAALERIGARLDGILRAHRMASDYTPRDSARYSIVAPEWPAAKQRLIALRDRRYASG